MRLKLNPLRENIRDKRLIVVDDSIVRGTTQHQLVRMLREAGAREVHLRITSPPVRWSCFYGIDTGDRSELIAHNLELDHIREYLNADSLAYLVARAAGRGHRGARRRVLRRLLHRQLPGRGAADPAQARAGGQRDADRRPDRAAGARRHHRLMGETYSGAGVDIAAGEAAVDRIKGIVRSTYRPEVLGDIGGFGGLVTLPEGYRQPVLVSSTDGVGTKAMVATAAGRFDTIGIDLVAMCVDDVVCQGAEPLFFLDYISVGALDPDQVEALVSGVAEGCRQAGCALVGGEMAEHPGAMAPGEFDLVGFVVGVAERDRILTGAAARAGDVLVGLPSPGLRSNGYSLARRVLFERAGMALDDELFAGHSVADELLRPSVIYAPAVRRLLGDVDVRAVAHITGGGIVGNLPRVLPPGVDAVLERSAWEVPRVFAEIQRLGDVSDDEMARVFNLGLGMVVVVPPEDVGRALGVLRDAGHAATEVGRLAASAGEGREVRLR